MRERKMNEVVINQEEVEEEQEVKEEVKEVEEEQIKRLIHSIIVFSGFEETFKPGYVWYSFGDENYFIAVSKQRRVVVFGGLAFMKTRGAALAVDRLPENFWYKPGPIIDYIQIDSAEIAYENNNAIIKYYRNNERTQIIVDAKVDEILSYVLRAERILVYDAIINYTRWVK